MDKKLQYECIKTTCGFIEPTKFAQSSTKKCPKCGGTMKRVVL